MEIIAVSSQRRLVLRACRAAALVTTSTGEAIRTEIKRAIVETHVRC